MSDNALPIQPARFAAALKDLPLSALHLKAAELRNSIAHLDYSNEELRPYAYPTSTSGSSVMNTTTRSAPLTNGHATHNESATTTGDPVCIEAIEENETVIRRMQERMGLLKAEVEERGASWIEFLNPEEVAKRLVEDEERLAPSLANGRSHSFTPAASNGTSGAGRNSSSPWADGTFQTGRISGGNVVMDGDVEGVADGIFATSTRSGPTGGRIGDDELRRRMEERMSRAEAEVDDDDGMHL